MADSPTGQDRTEPATERRRRQARERGNVPRSIEVTTVAILLAGLFYFRFAGESFIGETTRFLTDAFGRTATTDLSPQNAADLVAHTLAAVLLLLGPLFLVVCFAALLGNVIQFGLLFTSEPLLPKWDRISPIEGLKRIFSRRGANELLKSLVKITLVSIVAYDALHSEMGVLLELADALGVGQILITLGSVSFKVLLRSTLVLLAIAIVDYWLQRRFYEANLRMTRREVEEELRETEGDPVIRGRFRQIREQRARQAMLREVPSAEVVITNPTHVAVALRYDPARDAAPIVVAKGRGYLAERIRAIAEEHRVPIYQDPPLAQVLYKTVEVGSYIPESLFVALAEILAYLYRAGRLRRRVA